ncbi:MAG: alpha/beta fold hydrolase, partial [Mycobacterium sp.]
AVPAAPGVKLDCASYDADLDPVNGAAGTLSIGVVRARSVQTPSDAGPLVFTTGSDLPSSLQLPVWLSRAGADVLRSHPIVAVDRRGMGASSPVDCLDQFDRQQMRDQAQFEAGDDPVANLADITQNATTNCTDTIAPGDSAYDNTHSATDIERLRSIWDVPALALVGIGNGAQVALTYAGSHPDKVARLILDSPIGLGVGAEAAAEQRVKGQQAALDAFAAQCVAVNCPLGPDPKAAVDSLLADARAGHSPGGASVASVANAIATALGFPAGDRVTSTTDLATALANARSGDTNLLTNLINRAETTRDTDGQFVNSCSDALNRPTPDRVRELVVAWGKLYPQFGTVGALNLVKCVAWPSVSPPQPPKVLKVNVLLLGVQNDPIVGSEG